MTEPVPHAFARVKLEGERFAGGRLPVSALSELENYTALVRDAAELTWLEAHPGEELPEEFSSSFDLSLTAIIDGSADCVLERPRIIGEYDDYFDRARERVGLEIQQVLSGILEQTDEAIASLDAFGSFGGSLGAGESLVVPTRINEAPVRITRTQYVERIRPAYEYANSPGYLVDKTPHTAIASVEGWLVGRLNAISANNSKFELDTESYGPVRGFYEDDEILDDLRAVLGRSERAPVVRIFGNLQFRADKFFRMRNASKVQVLEIDGQPWSRRFVEVASLEAGWDDDDPDSQPVSFAALDGARSLLTHARESGKSQPGIFPQTDGGVSLEWASPEKVYSVEISPDSEFHLFRLGPDNVSTNLETMNIKDAQDFIDSVEFP